MATAVCGCECQREQAGVWRVVDASDGCALHHQVGQRGFELGAPAPLDGVGDCVTVLFERASRSARISRTSMLVTALDAPPRCADASARAAPQRSR
jgi:hypothetical protein